MTPQEYSAVVKRNSPKSKTYVNCLAAFCIGGGICAVGQGFFEAYNSKARRRGYSRTNHGLCERDVLARD